MSLYVAELCMALLGLCLHKKGGAPLAEFLPRPAGIVLLASFVIGLGALTFIYREYVSSRGTSVREFRFTLIVNVLSVAAALGIAEVSLRLFVTDREGMRPRLGSTVLLPHSWDRVSRGHRQLLREASDGGRWAGSFLVSHPVLGWTHGSNRSSRDGLSFSSYEGIRSPRRNVRYRGQASARTVAIVGDSYTFGLDVSFEDTWGHHLDRLLGPEFRVLNFGVDGYGVDQAYLRYLEEVADWQPEVVVLGFIEHDLERTLGVYPFVTFGWPFPFTKPRFVLGPDGLARINTPLLDPADIFSVASVDALPFIDRDAGYRADDWRERWFHNFMTLRYMTSRFPRWNAATAARIQEKIALNAAILRSFVDRVRANGSEPLVVYFPSAGAGDFPGLFRVKPNRRGRARQVLREAQVEYADLTSCLRGVPAGDRMAAGDRHYSPRSNAAVAGCLQEQVEFLVQ
ncbi:MAG: SGNH/GDSL hydrolase family protein [Myxococcota bacterium]